MVLEGKGKLIEYTKGKLMIYIPTKVHNDSAFPFNSKDDVRVKIIDGKLIIEKYEKK